MSDGFELVGEVFDTTQSDFKALEEVFPENLLMDCFFQDREGCWDFLLMLHNQTEAVSKGLLKIMAALYPERIDGSKIENVIPMSIIEEIHQSDSRREM